MISTYNKEHVGDVLMILIKEVKDAKRNVERKGKVARIFLEETGETLAWNIFEVSEVLDLKGSGQVYLSEEQVASLNALLAQEGFTEELAYDGAPKLVVAEIVEMEDHPDSDHLHICQVKLGERTEQIVCGAPNAAVGLKTVAALPGAMMPDGNLIFPGQLRGVASYGMLCSARELALPNAPQVRGIIELREDVQVGAAFDPVLHWQA